LVRTAAPRGLALAGARRGEIRRDRTAESASGHGVGSEAVSHDQRFRRGGAEQDERVGREQVEQTAAASRSADSERRSGRNGVAS
jgi:hypothetical protein